MKTLLLLSLISLISACSNLAPDYDATLLSNSNVTINVTPLANGQCQIVPQAEVNDNCAIINPNNPNICSDDAGCICTDNRKEVTWKINMTDNSPGYEFALLPKDDVEFPFKTKKCKIYSDGSGQVSCEIKKRRNTIFQYNVMVAGCKNVLDPKIVIGAIR